MDTKTMCRIVEAYIEQEKGVTVRIREPRTQKELTLLTRAYVKANLFLKK
jgi:hypothetical protein